MPPIQICRKTQVNTVHMLEGQEKSFIFPRSEFAKSRGLQCYDDKLIQIRIEDTDAITSKYAELN